MQSQIQQEEAEENNCPNVQQLDKVEDNLKWVQDTLGRAEDLVGEDYQNLVDKAKERGISEITTFRQIS